MAVSSAAKETRKPRSHSTHPPFLEMISDAIVALKERTGSSQYAITKFIEEKHGKSLPSNFGKLLLVHLKRLVASGKLVKVKNSFKLAPAGKSAAKKTEKVARTETEKKVAAVKGNKKVKKAAPKKPKSVKSPVKKKKGKN